MRFRLFSTVAVVGLTVAVAVAAGTAGAKTGKPSASGAAATGTAKVFTTPSALTTLFDNNSNDSGIGISSQNFETSFDAYDDAAADDFIVPANTKWKVKQVDVTGVYFNGAGPAVSENVTFYTNHSKLPNTVKTTYSGLVGTDNGTGSFVINLPTATTLNGGLNPAGKHYWVSVQINMDFNPSGQWGWEGSLNSVGYADAWENPGDGFGTGCTTWGVETTCIGDVGQGPSKMFTLKGKVVVP